MFQAESQRDSLKPSFVYQHLTHSQPGDRCSAHVDGSWMTTGSSASTTGCRGQGFTPPGCPGQQQSRLQKSPTGWFKAQAVLCAHGDCGLRRRAVRKAAEMRPVPAPGKPEHLFQLRSICGNLLIIEAVECFLKAKPDPRAKLSLTKQAVSPAKPGSLLLENLLLVSFKRHQTTEE